MNRQELMKRWLRAQIEPSLFYVPEKKKDVLLYHIVGLKIYARYYKVDAQEIRTFWFAGGVNPTEYPFPKEPGIREYPNYPFFTRGRWVIYDENKKIVWSSWRYIYDEYSSRFLEVNEYFDNIHLPKGKYTLVEIVPPTGTILHSEPVSFIVGGSNEECDIGVDLELQTDMLLQAVFPQNPDLIVNRLITTDGETVEFPYDLKKKTEYLGYDRIFNHCAYYQYTITVMDAGNGKVFQTYKIMPQDISIMTEYDRNGNAFLCSNGGGSGEVCDKYYHSDYTDGWCKYMIHVPAKYENHYLLNGFWLFSSIVFVRDGDGSVVNREYEDLYDCAEGYIEGRYDEQYVLDTFCDEYASHPYPKQWEDQYYNTSYFNSYFRDSKPYLVTNYRPDDLTDWADDGDFRFTSITERTYIGDSFRDWTDDDDIIIVGGGETLLCAPTPTKQYDRYNYYSLTLGVGQYLAKKVDENLYDKFIEINTYLKENAEGR